MTSLCSAALRGRRGNYWARSRVTGANLRAIPSCAAVPACCADLVRSFLFAGLATPVQKGERLVLPMIGSAENTMPRSRSFDPQRGNMHRL